MKNMYNIGDDLFVIMGFTAFIIGIVLKLLDVPVIIWGITPNQLISGAAFCLLFSIALSLRELAHLEK